MQKDRALQYDQGAQVLIHGGKGMGKSTGGNIPGWGVFNILLEDGNDLLIEDDVSVYVLE